MRKRNGFTLPELMVVMPIAVLVMGTFFAYMSGLYIDNLKHVNRMLVTNDTNRALNAISTDIMLSIDFRSSLSPGVGDSYGPPGGGNWSGNSNQPYSTLIARLPATSRSLQDPDNALIREDENGCSPSNLLTNPIHSYNTVHFVHNGNLYRRTLKHNSPASLCGTVFQKTTCPASANQPSCPKDVLLANGVTEFHVRYETPKTGTVANPTCPSGSVESSAEDGLSVCEVNDPADAQVVTVFLTVSREAGGETFSYSHRFTNRALNKDLPTQ